MTMTIPTFDMEAALKALREGKDLTGKDGILTPLIKQLAEAALKAELEAHLAAEEAPNRKNGSTAKTIKGLSGSFELQTPRDRAGTVRQQAPSIPVTKLHGLALLRRLATTADGEHGILQGVQPQRAFDVGFVDGGGDKCR